MKTKTEIQNEVIRETFISDIAQKVIAGNDSLLSDEQWDMVNRETAQRIQDELDALDGLNAD
jgi:hypothetical protein